MAAAGGDVKSAFVTGCAGYIGSALCKRLLQDGVRVVGFDNLSRGHRDAVPDGVEFVEGDIRDPALVEWALALFGDTPPDACLHLAALALVEESMREPDLYHDVNVNGTQALIGACLRTGVRKFVLASSAAVLGSGQPDADGHMPPHGEDALVAPTNPYGASKFAAEELLRTEATRPDALDGVVLRLFNVAGAVPGCPERHDPETHLIPSALLATKDKPLRVHASVEHMSYDGTCIRDYVHVRDVAEAFVRAAGYTPPTGFDVFHVGSGQGVTNKDVVDCIEWTMSRDVPQERAGPRPGDASVLVSNNTKLKALLGLHPSTDLSEMVRDAAGT